VTQGGNIIIGGTSVSIGEFECWSKGAIKGNKLSSLSSIVPYIVSLATKLVNNENIDPPFNLQIDYISLFTYANGVVFNRTSEVAYLVNTMKCNPPGGLDGIYIDSAPAGVRQSVNAFFSDFHHCGLQAGE
jgi:hypothetical protein